MSLDPSLAPAKINLALHVTGQRNDGYHLLDSLVCFADIGDRLKIELTAAASTLVKVKVSGKHAGDLGTATAGNIEQNLVVRAATMLAQKLKDSGISCPEITISLEKNLPIAAGIGGGSADAAATLVLLENIWAKGQALNLTDIAIQLGADVPMCLDNQPKRVTGTGQILSGFNLATALPIVLVNPNIPLSTARVFEALTDKKQQPICDHPNIAMPGTFNTIDEVVELLSPLRNDLQAPAIMLVPQIGEVLAQIKSMPGCLLSRMTGSGATCFGIFESTDKAASAITKIKEDHADWWSIACNTIPAEITSEKADR